MKKCNKKKPKSFAPKPKRAWRARLAKRKSDEIFSFVVEFPTVDGEGRTCIVARTGAGKVGTIVDELKYCGAKFPESKKERQFILELLEAADKKGVKGSIVNRCGWHGDTFVKANSTVTEQRDTRAGDRFWLQPSKHSAYLFASEGDLKGWKQKVGTPARSSSLVMFAIGAALAAPLARHAGWPEGVIFNFAGPSSTGKTTAAKAAASVSGDPNAIYDWNSTDAGMEELHAANSDYLTIFDDTERTSSEIANRIKSITHVSVGGKSKSRSSSVMNSLPELDWFNVTLMTSPEPIAEYVERKGIEHTLGEKVRLIDLRVPDGTTGVFDLLEEGASPAHQAEMLQRGFERHYGVLIKAWIKKLPDLKDKVADELNRHIQKYEKKAGRELASAERRILRKLLLPLYAANEARRAGLLPWIIEDIREMNRRVVRPAMSLLEETQNPARQVWQAFANRLSSRDGFFDLRDGAKLTKTLLTKPAHRADVGVTICDQKLGDLVGLALCWIDRLKTPSGNPVLMVARNASGAKHGSALDLAEQRRLKHKSRKTYRPRLVYLTVEQIELLVRAHAGVDFEDWKLDR